MYLASRFAAPYRVIVDVLLAEQDTSLTGLSYDEGVADGGRHDHRPKSRCRRAVSPAQTRTAASTTVVRIVEGLNGSPARVLGR